MSSTGTVSPQPQQGDIYTAYKNLYDSLNDAYWAASTIEAKDRIAGQRDQVYTVIMDLVADDIKSRTADFQALRTKVNDVNKRLKVLSDEIAQLVARVSTANAVVSGIAQVLGLSLKFFA